MAEGKICFSAEGKSFISHGWLDIQKRGSFSRSFLWNSYGIRAIAAFDRKQLLVPLAASSYFVFIFVNVLFHLLKQ